MGNPARPAHYVLVTSTKPKQAWDGKHDLVGELPPELRAAIIGAIDDMVKLGRMSMEKVSAEFVYRKLRNGQFWGRIREASDPLLRDLIDTIIRQESRRRPPERT
ncbi:hypothetical protein AB0K12_27820 [Nonomuraea sp. NPDC049419]|uniref:hypothetical protein n=1 Tax=Nonomuraea sp. NPDC049419 TaxID=3155772 RepID=UPI003429ADC2